MIMVVTGISKKIKKNYAHRDKIDGCERQLIRREWIDNKRLDENTMYTRRARGWTLNATTLCLECCLNDKALYGYNALKLAI